MTKRFSLAEARKSLPGILDSVEAGSDVELTRRGKPVAVLVSTREYQRLHTERPAFGEAFRRFLARHRLPSPALDKSFIRALREKNPGRRVTL